MLSVHSIVEDFLMYVRREPVKCPVISEDFVTVGSVDTHVRSVLFDSGGLCDSLISKRLVDANRSE